MLAFSARRFVWSATFRIWFVSCCTRSTSFDSSILSSSVFPILTIVFCIHSLADTASSSNFSAFCPTSPMYSACDFVSCMTDDIISLLLCAFSAILCTMSLISRTLPSIAFMVAFTFDTSFADEVTILFTCSELLKSFFSLALIFWMISRKFSRKIFKLSAIFPTSSVDLTFIFCVRSPSFFASSLIFSAITLTFLDKTPLIISASAAAITNPASSMITNSFINMFSWSLISVAEQSTPTIPAISPELL